MSNVFQELIDMTDKQNAKINKTFPVGDYYKEATESLVAYLDKVGYHVKDLQFSDSYFIFGKGTNSVVSFHIDETPNWLYGIWWKVAGIDNDHPRKGKKLVLEKIKNKELDINGEFFCQYEPEIDKFKPSRSEFVEELIISVFEESNDWSYNYVEKVIDFIYKQPYLAWMHDFEGIDFNREYHTSEEAKEEYDKYFNKKVTRVKRRDELQLEWLKFLRKIFANQLDNVRVMDNGENWSPRFDIYLVLDDFSNEVFDEDDREFGRASCHFYDIPFDVFGLDTSIEEIKNKWKELDSVEYEDDNYFYFHNEVSDWLEITTKEKYEEYRKDGIEMPTLEEFINKVYSTLNVFGG